jgi:predicted P-loop ATPase
MVPVLIGAQGEGKSFGLESMVPSEDFYTSINLMARDADQARCMRGRLVIEIGELRGLHSRDMESIKDFITRRYETWIPKYKEFSKNYLPVLCGKVKVARIKADRAQLWAEARDRFELLGVDWQGAQRLAEGVHETHRMTDSWADQIDSWLHLPGVGEPAPVDLPYLQMNDIFREAFGMDIKNVKRTDEQRVAGVLRERGYEKKFERVDGKVARVWVKGSRMRVRT